MIKSVTMRMAWHGWPTITQSTALSEQLAKESEYVLAGAGRPMVKNDPLQTGDFPPCLRGTDDHGASPICKPISQQANCRHGCTGASISLAIRMAQKRIEKCLSTGPWRSDSATWFAVHHRGQVKQ